MLHALVYRNLQQTRPVTTVLHLQFHYHGFTSSSSNLNTSISVEYLMNSCGLPLKEALIASKKFHLKRTENPDLVLTLLKNHGLTENYITKLISKNPLILNADIDKTLVPKIEYLSSLGVSGLRLFKILTSDAQFLHRSLENQIIPSVDFIKRFTDTNEEFLTILNRPWKIFQIKLENVMGPNVAILTNYGVPKCNVLKLFILNPWTLSLRNDRFKTVVDEIKGMGFHSSSSMFVHAIRARSAMSKSNWEEKWAFFRKLGFSHEEILLVFKNLPTCLMYSKEKIQSAVEFFTIKQNFKLSDIAKRSVVLSLSLEKRSIPRCNVLEVLYLNGLTGKLNAGSVTSALKLNEKMFLEKFMMKYQDAVPKMVIAYKSKIGLAELEEKDGLQEMQKG